MFISSSDYDSLVEKGVAGMIAERSEGGYFEKVFSIHPLARKSRIIPICHGHDLIEMGFDALPLGGRWKAMRIVYSPIYVLMAALRIRRIIQKENINVVRSSDPYWAATVGWLGTRFTKAHFVISIHANWEKCHNLDKKNGAPKLLYSRTLARILAYFLMRQAKRVLCIRRSLFESAITAGARPESIRFIPHGIDLNLFNQGDRSLDITIPGGKKIILFAGRLSRENYIYDVIEVARMLQERSDCCMVIAGGGGEELRLREMICAEPKLKVFTLMLGFISRKDLFLLRSLAYLNIAPMGGYSLIEACASGRPTIAYDVEWHNEIIQNGYSGYLVPEGNVSELYSVITKLLDDEKLATKIGIEGKKAAYEKHDINNVVKVRANVYDEMIRG